MSNSRNPLLESACERHRKRLEAADLRSNPVLAHNLFWLFADELARIPRLRREQLPDSGSGDRTHALVTELEDWLEAVEAGPSSGPRVSLYVAWLFSDGFAQIFRPRLAEAWNRGSDDRTSALLSELQQWQQQLKKEFGLLPAFPALVHGLYAAALRVVSDDGCKADAATVEALNRVGKRATEAVSGDVTSAFVVVFGPTPDCPPSFPWSPN